MKVLTPNGVEEYRWDDQYELPQKVPYAGGVLFGPGAGGDNGQQPSTDGEAFDLSPGAAAGTGS